MMKLVMITMIIKPVDSGVVHVADFQANPVVYHRVMYKDTHHHTSFYIRWHCIPKPSNVIIIIEKYLKPS
jgi:hypothetical protein